MLCETAGGVRIPNTARSERVRIQQAHGDKSRGLFFPAAHCHWFLTFLPDDPCQWAVEIFETPPANVNSDPVIFADWVAQAISGKPSLLGERIFLRRGMSKRFAALQHKGCMFRVSVRPKRYLNVACRLDRDKNSTSRATRRTSADIAPILVAANAIVKQQANTQLDMLDIEDLAPTDRLGSPMAIKLEDGANKSVLKGDESGLITKYAYAGAHLTVFFVWELKATVFVNGKKVKQTT